MHKIRYYYSLVLTVVLVALANILCAQQDSSTAVKDTIPTIDYSQQDLPLLDNELQGTYEIGGINIVGAVNRDRNAIKSLAGFREGDKIQIPGTLIPKAIKSLWKLRLFEDVQIIAERFEGKVVFLQMILKERPVLSRYSYSGVKKSHHDDLNDIVNGVMSKGGIVTEDQKRLVTDKIKEHYMEKGKLDTEVKVKEVIDNTKKNTVRLEFEIDTKDRVKVEDIVINGNENISDRKVRKKMHNTKRKGTWFRKTKFIESGYEQDKKDVIIHYNKEGFRDAKIIKDTVYREVDGDIMVELDIKEGNRYFFRNIIWKGNSLYSDNQLTRVLGIERGDIYNPELLENRLRFSQDGRDISSLFLDDGYLGFDVRPVEVAIENDSIDLEMRIFEGPQFVVDKVTIAGNDRTNEHVIRRELRTKPGQKFSRTDIIRSQRQIIGLGYFNPESLDIQTPVNQGRGTVDIAYTVEERPADQLELSAGYGGFNGLIGTLGVTFNNFSLANIRSRSSWSPLPQGDGQKLSLRAQSNSRFFRSYNFSLTEPWLGGKKPNSFTVGMVHSAFDYSTLGSGSLKITRGFVGLGTQLKWPDDFFVSNTTLNLERITLEDYDRGGFFVQENGRNIAIKEGSFNNFSLKQTFTRSSVSDPLYPRRGSRVSLSIQVTPPYSLFRGDDYYQLSEAEILQVEKDLTLEYGPAVPPTRAEILSEVQSIENAKKFEWLEYHKWRFDSEWYFNVYGKFVIAAKAKLGVLGTYNDEIGYSPFERFELGGDGLSNQSSGITGKDIISLRGYETSDLIQNRQGGATVYDKFTMELRYPLSLNPNSSIYLLSFLQGGNSWGSFDDFNPFDMRRSAGFGARIFLPMFGLLGFDYGWGFDKELGLNATAGQYGKFSIILGFEPE